MNTKLNALIIIVPLIMLGFYSTAFSYKDGAPVARTGAPGENSCGSGTTGCHFKPASQCGSLIGELLPLNTDIELTANGVVVDQSFEYTPDTAYNMEFKILNPTANGGFSLTCLNLANEFVGTLTTTDPNASVISNTTNTKDYVGHVVSLATQSWSFVWTAPAAGEGDITFYASANKANGAVGQAPINSCGDKIVPYKMKISEFVEEEPNTIKLSNIALQKNSKILNNPILNNTISIDLFVKEPKRVTVIVYDLSGKIITSKEQYFHVGSKNMELSLSQKGLFIINITTDKNEMANYKILN